MKKRILVVDDWESIRETFALILTEANYEVLSASDGEEAINILAKDSGFDLVITDVRMPKKRGEELIKYIKLAHPHIKTIFVSSDDGVDALINGADAVFSKINMSFPELVETAKKFAPP